MALGISLFGRSYNILEFAWVYVSLHSGVLPSETSPGSAHDQCYAAIGLYPECDYRAEEVGSGLSRGGHQMGAPEI